VVREGLKQILRETKDIVVNGEAKDAQEVLDMVRAKKWDVVLLDISMPGRNGLDILKQLKQNHPGLPILVLSMHPEDQYGLRALKAGASGYLTKECAPAQLEDAIRKVLTGGKYVSPHLAEKLAFHLDADLGKPLHESLSDREYQIFQMIASGKTVSGIAAELCLSVKTVSTHRSRILEKMRMKNNSELTRYAFENNLANNS